MHAIRQVLYWKQVAPYPTRAHRPAFDATNPINYAWGNYDAVVSEARARGWSVLLTVSGPVPRWATALRRDNVTRPIAHQFGLFYLDRRGPPLRLAGADLVGLERGQPSPAPSSFPQHARQPPPRTYRGLFQAAVAGLHAAGLTGAHVLMGETAPRGTGHDVSPLAFLRGALCLDSSYHMSSTCSALPADGYALPRLYYTTLAGPSFVPPDPTTRDDRAPRC